MSGENFRIQMYNMYVINTLFVCGPKKMKSYFYKDIILNVKINFKSMIYAR